MAEGLVEFLVLTDEDDSYYLLPRELLECARATEQQAAQIAAQLGVPLGAQGTGVGTIPRAQAAPGDRSGRRWYGILGLIRSASVGSPRDLVILAEQGGGCFLIERTTLQGAKLTREQKAEIVRLLAGEDGDGLPHDGAGWTGNGIFRELGVLRRGLAPRDMHAAEE